MNNTNRFLSNIIENSQGRFVTCTFVKKDGTIRTLNGRMGVTRHLKTANDKPNGNPSKHQKYITIWDAQKRAYRSINRESILQVNAEGASITNRKV